jgi:hypothetical protein
MMNDEVKTICLSFIVHRSDFIVSSLPGGHAGARAGKLSRSRRR